MTIEMIYRHCSNLALELYEITVILHKTLGEREEVLMRNLVDTEYFNELTLDMFKIHDANRLEVWFW